MPQMTKNQIDEFLSGKHLMKLATLSPDGYPYVNPVWFIYDGQTFTIGGRDKSEWVAYIKSDARVSFCIDTCELPYARVIIKGTAVIEDPAWISDGSFALKYLGDSEGKKYSTGTKDNPRALVRITPEHWITWVGIDWHPRYEAD